MCPSLPRALVPNRTVNVYHADGANNFSPAVQGDPALVYVPNSMSNTVDVISQRTMKVVAQFPTGALPSTSLPPTTCGRSTSTTTSATA